MPKITYLEENGKSHTIEVSNMDDITLAHQTAASLWLIIPADCLSSINIHSIIINAQHAGATHGAASLWLITSRLPQLNFTAHVGHYFHCSIVIPLH